MRESRFLEDKIDAQEQYSRRCSVRIGGNKEKEWEDMVEVASQILSSINNINVEKKDINRARRIGPKKSEITVTTKDRLLSSLSITLLRHW